MSGHFISGLESEDKARALGDTCQYVYDSCCVCDPAAGASDKEQHGYGYMRSSAGRRRVMAHRTFCMVWKKTIWYLGLAFSGYIGYGFFRFLIRRLYREKAEDLKAVRIPLGEKNVCLKALLDTGNHLCEPVNGAPVCIISESAAGTIQDFFLPERYHAIPFQSIGKKRGILDAYELPELIIEDTYREICCKRVIVAICNTGISQDSLYQMILHPQLMEN